MTMKADWAANICPACGARLRTCCDSPIGDSHMTSCYKLGPFREPLPMSQPDPRKRVFAFVRLIRKVVS